MNYTIDSRFILKKLVYWTAFITHGLRAIKINTPFP